MNRNWLTQFGWRGLGNWGIIFFISSSLAFIILMVIVPKENSEVKIEILPAGSELKYSLHLIAPAQLGVEHWQIGDYAEYKYRKRLPQSVLPAKETDTDSNFSVKTLGFHIIDELKASDFHRYWLRITGMLFFREVPGDIYQLGRPIDIQMTSENRRYEYLQNYFPIKVRSYDQDAIPLVKLVELGQAEIETEAGRFDCIHYRVELGEDFPAQELWANSKVRPLGIVRIRSGDETLELTSFGKEKEVKIPKLIQPVIQGISTLNHGCTSCHGQDNCHESIFPPK